MTISALTSADGKSSGLAPGWDWYAATLPETVDYSAVLGALETIIGGDARVVSGFHGYGSRFELRHGKEVAVSASWGGSHDRVLVEASGASSPAAARLVRRLWPEHRVTRVDSAVDFDEEGAWAELSGLALSVARDRGIKTEVRGDWFGKKNGRTLYLGGRSAMVRLRVYEKGIQLPEADRPYWVRCELQVRPEKALKGRVASLSPAEVWGISRWAGDVWGRLGGVEVAPVALSTWRLPDQLRARNALVRQYARHLVDWADELGGADVLGRVLIDEALEVLGGAG